ncbi:MAG: dephospho-CoA kinase [Phycisphaerales bacterium]
MTQQPTPLAPPPPIVLGIAGGIGAGKSTVARVFEAHGVPVFDADANAKAHLNDDAVQKQLRERFGDGVIDADGLADRSALASIVFADRAKLKALESILHPLVLADQRAFIEAARANGTPTVMIDAPLLFEAGFDAHCHAIVFVEADRATRLARVTASRGWSEEDFDAREAAQWPLERKRAGAAHIVENSLDSAALDAQVRSILATLERDQTR